MREQLRHLLASPRRWQGGLRRTLFARAIRGSNSIEGYHVSVEDAVAAVDDAQPLGTDATTWHEVVGYRHTMGYVLRLGQDPDFAHQPSVLRGMHYMLLSHDLSKSPGHYRQGPIFVQDAGSGRQVYQGPDHELVADLVDELCAGMEQSQGEDVLVTEAMAHLNLVMIHPFRDGNGRMARALQTLVLARGSIVAPEFASIEEWLGRNTQDYYRVLAWTGNGAWNPLRDTHLWVKFNLRAHHMQAQTVRWRTDFARALWHGLEEVADGHGLPDRTVHALYDAATSIRFRRPTYVVLADVEPRTATRDLAQMVGAGLLEGRGATRARVYSAGEPLRRIAAEVAGGQRGSRRATVDHRPLPEPDGRARGPCGTAGPEARHPYTPRDVGLTPDLLGRPHRHRSVEAVRAGWLRRSGAPSTVVVGGGCQPLVRRPRWATNREGDVVMRRILGAVVALLVVSVLAACGSVGDAVSSEGEGSRVVSGESSESSESTESATPVADADAETEAEAEAEQAAVIEVVEHGFTQLPSGEYDSPPQVSYGVVFANSGDAIAVDARVQITFNGADGGVVTTQEEYLTAVLPGQQAALGASLYDTDGVASMSVQVLPGSSEPADDVAGAFEVSQVATSVEEYGGLTTTATVASPFTKDLQDLYATAIHRGPDGAIVGGDFTFLSFVPAGGTAGVEIMTAANLPAPTSSEVYVQLSGLSLLE